MSIFHVVVKGSLLVTKVHFAAQGLALLVGAFKHTIEAEIVKHLDALLAPNTRTPRRKKQREREPPSQFDQLSDSISQLTAAWHPGWMCL